MANELIGCRKNEAIRRQIYERANYLVSKFGEKSESGGSLSYINHSFTEYADGTVLVFQYLKKSDTFRVSWGTHLVFRTVKGEITAYKPYASWIRALNKLTETEFETPEWEEVPEEFPKMFTSWDIDVRSVLYPSEMRERI